MKKRWIHRIVLSVSMLLMASTLWAVPKLGFSADSTHYVDGTKVYPETAIYQGMYVKLDLGSPIVNLAVSGGKIHNYEIAVSCRLKQRFYPVWEGGFSIAKGSADGGNYDGKGGFMRVGVDLNGLKKQAHRLDAMLVGIRFAGAVQNYNLSSIVVQDPFGQLPTMDFEKQHRFDCWGEVVAGVNVQIYAGLTMGWAFRLGILMTRKAKNNGPLPYYIPGFGYRNDLNCGLSYYIGYHF